MREAITHWIYTLFAGLVVGPIAGILASSVHGIDGSPDATGLVSEAPAMGLIKILICVVLAGFVMVLGGAMGYTRRAYFAGGLVLSWAALRAGTVPGIVRATGGDGVFVRMALEAAVLGVVFAAFAWATLAIRRRKDDTFSMPAKSDGTGVLACVLVGLVVAWAAAQDGSGGQALFAAYAAGLVGTLVASVIVPGCSLVSLIAAGVVMSVAGPILFVILGGSPLSTVYSGNLAGYAALTPLTWLAGVSTGMWGGSSWAESFVQKHEAKPAAKGTRDVARG